MQETNSLKLVKDGFKKIVLVKDDIEVHHNEDGIQFVSVEDFLIGKVGLTN